MDVPPMADRAHHVPGAPRNEARRWAAVWKRAAKGCRVQSIQWRTDLRQARIELKATADWLDEQDGIAPVLAARAIREFLVITKDSAGEQEAE